MGLITIYNQLIFETAFNEKSGSISKDIVNYIERKYNTGSLKYEGKGSEGVVFSSKKHAWKITMYPPSEYLHSRINKKFKHTINIYNIFTLEIPKSTIKSYFQTREEIMGDPWDNNKHHKPSQKKQDVFKDNVLQDFPLLSKIDKRKIKDVESVYVIQMERAYPAKETKENIRRWMKWFNQDLEWSYHVDLHDLHKMFMYDHNIRFNISVQGKEYSELKEFISSDFWGKDFTFSVDGLLESNTGDFKYDKQKDSYKVLMPYPSGLQYFTGISSGYLDKKSFIKSFTETYKRIEAMKTSALLCYLNYFHPEDKGDLHKFIKSMLGVYKEIKTNDIHMGQIMKNWEGNLIFVDVDIEIENKVKNDLNLKIKL